MLCGQNPKTSRCKRVSSVKEASTDCEVNNSTKQKRCRRKTIKMTKKKKCSKGKILNPKTNRCINKLKTNKKKKKKKTCPPGKILNPTTGRCIIDRELDEDKVIDFKYRCKPGYIYNPETERCVNKEGPTGKKLSVLNEVIIGGPISMHYYKFKVNNVMKHFLLFGDMHTQYIHHISPEKIEIPTLIKKIVRKSPHCIDIFSENAIYHGQAQGKKLQKHKSPLNAIRDEFGGCPIHNLKDRKCDYDNLRYQNWDLRFKPSRDAKQSPNTPFKSNPYDELFMKYPEQHDIFSREFSNRDMVLYILGFTKMISPHILKKIDNKFNVVLKEKFKENSFREEVADKTLLDERRILIQKEYQKCIRNVNFPKDLLETFIQNYNSLEDIDYTLVFTDFYAICRMFINFDTNKQTPKRCPIQGQNNFRTPQYIIYYAGDQHTLHIYQFLELMFSIRPIYTTRNKYPGGNTKKLIHIKDVRDANGSKLKDVESVDDLLREFYE
jgi:hypothetical protein